VNIKANETQVVSKIQASSFRIQDSSFRTQASGFKLQDPSFRIPDTGFRFSNSKFQVSVVLLSFLLCPLTLFGADGDTGNKPLKFRGISLDLKKKRVEVQGSICLDQGLIEYLACARGGKEHESLLVMDCKPLELFLALQTLGLRPGKGVDFQGERRTPSGDKVYLYVEYKEEDKVVRHRLEDLVWNIQAKKPMKRTHWIFVGSRFLKDPDTGKPIFMAQLEGNIIASFHDPYAIFDHTLDTGADDTFYHTNDKIVPQVGTPIKLIILREELKEK